MSCVMHMSSDEDCADRWKSATYRNSNFIEIQEEKGNTATCHIRLIVCLILEVHDSKHPAPKSSPKEEGK